MNVLNLIYSSRTNKFDYHLSDFPLVTWVLTGIIIVVAAVTFQNLSEAIRNWGLIPNEYARHYGVTFISSFFLHGSLLHLIGNLYFLIMFGRRVEGVLGVDRYLLLVILSALAGDIAHILINPGSIIPIVGASGGISGIMAYYCLSFPRSEVRMSFAYIPFRISVKWFFFFWVIMQFFTALLQISGQSSVSAVAHFGGAIIGLIFWKVIVQRQTKQYKLKW